MYLSITRHHSYLTSRYFARRQSPLRCRHTELDGALFPFSRGCSFYVVDDSGKITWGRDCVESAPPKPGDSTIAALGVLAPVLRGVGLARADPANLSKLPLQSAAMWAFYAGPQFLCRAVD